MCLFFFSLFTPFKRILLLMIPSLMIGYNLYGQKPKDLYAGINEVPGFSSGTYDILLWDEYVDSIYRISKSPIIFFKAFKDFKYPNSEGWHFDPSYEGGSYDGQLLLEHSITWAIIDSVLYLFDVNYDMVEDNQLEYEKRHLPIEEYTKMKCSSPEFQIHDAWRNRINPNGVILAQWFSDTLYIKPKIFFNVLYRDIKRLNIEPYYYRMIFKEGKITEIEKTMVDEDNVLVYSHWKEWAENLKKKK